MYFTLKKKFSKTSSPQKRGEVLEKKWNFLNLSFYPLMGIAALVEIASILSQAKPKRYALD